MNVSARLNNTRPHLNFLVEYFNFCFFLALVVPGGGQRLSRKQVAFSLGSKGLGGHLVFYLNGAVLMNDVLWSRLYFCFFVYPNTHICLAFYSTRLEKEKDKVEAFDLICQLGLRVLRRRFWSLYKLSLLPYLVLSTFLGGWGSQRE